MKLRCIIVDDEPLAAGLLKSYAEQIPFLSLEGVFHNALEALPAINEQRVELLFLDINMPKISGLEFSKTLPATVKVIFTTAYNQYAIEGFKVNALDYLLKPISYADFFTAANKALEWFKMVGSSTDESIFVKSGYRIKKLDYDQILYIENQKDYVKFYLENQAEPVSSLMSIQQLSEKLPGHIFMRIHRSFIVNLNKIRTIERNCLIFGKVYIPVSDSYRDRFNAFLDGKII